MIKITQLYLIPSKTLKELFLEHDDPPIMPQHWLGVTKFHLLPSSIWAVTNHTTPTPEISPSFTPLYFHSIMLQGPKTKMEENLKFFKYDGILPNREIQYNISIFFCTGCYVVNMTC